MNLNLLKKYIPVFLKRTKNKILAPISLFFPFSMDTSITKVTCSWTSKTHILGNEVVWDPSWRRYSCENTKEWRDSPFIILKYWTGRDDWFLWPSLRPDTQTLGGTEPLPPPPQHRLAHNWHNLTSPPRCCKLQYKNWQCKLCDGATLQLFLWPTRLETQLKNPSLQHYHYLWPVGPPRPATSPSTPHDVGLPSTLWLPFHAKFSIQSVTFLDKWVVIVTCPGHLSADTGLRYTGRTWLRWELIRFFP